MVISEGRSYAFLVHASLLASSFLVLGFFFKWPFVLVVPSLALLLLTTGVEVDLRNKSARKYRGWLGYHQGVWLPLSHFQKAVLEDFEISRSAGGRHRFNTSSSRTFDVLLLDRYGKEFELNDFFEYKSALRCIGALEKAGLEVEDKYAQHTRKLFAKHRRR